MKRTIILIWVGLFAVLPGNRATYGADTPPTPVPVQELGTKYQLIGQVGEPLGSVVTVRGVIGTGRSKADQSKPQLRVRSINGRTTQQDIMLPIYAYFGEFGEDGLPALELGQYYEFEAYESGGYIGVPSEVFERGSAVIQTTDHFFCTHLVGCRGSAIAPIVDAPSDFIDREALIQGIAKNLDGRPCIVGGGWILRIDADAPWSDSDVGKQAEAYGTIRHTDDATTYFSENSAARLSQLEDQIGRHVTLRGTVWNGSNHLRFEYRGTYVELEASPAQTDWDNIRRLHGEPVEASGVLDDATPPAMRQTTGPTGEPVKPYYILRQSSWKRIDELLFQERPDR
ncbi:MAG: hypothetical protein IT445_17870 [Phycisphaeraceae bacterium]|nr:hypothetical protein [Phycisphaeraceae bacterium]